MSDAKLRSFIAGPLPHQIGAFIATAFTAWILYAYWHITDKLEYLDYCNSFYVAGLLSRAGLFNQLYPIALDPSFAETAFNKFAHTIITHLPAHFNFTFMYPPLIALILAPLSAFSMRTALILWQVISLIALAIAACITAKLPQVNRPVGNLFFFAFLSLPLLHVLIFGQVTVIFGLLPLVVGYLMWQQGKDLLAGIAWSFLSMKLQLFVPVALITLSCLISSSWRTKPKLDSDRSATQLTIGMIAGLVMYHGLPVLFLGPSVFAGWLNVVNLAFKTTHVVSHAWAYHLTVSLPNAILFLTPSAWQSAAGPLSKVVGLIGTAIAVVSLVKISLNTTVAATSKKEMLITVACLFPPLIAPYLRIYDCTLLLLPTWLIFFRNGLTNGFEQTAFKALLAVWVALDLYVISIFVIGRDHMAIPQIGLLLVLVAACWRVTRSALMTK